MLSDVSHDGDHQPPFTCDKRPIRAVRGWQALVTLADAVIYIPTHDAASTIGEVLDRIPLEIRSTVGEILVIDNASKDGTGDLVARYAMAAGLTNLVVLRNRTDRGYGGSQKQAYARCIERGYRCVAMLHGDAQYAPELIEEVLGPVLTGRADLVFGSRMRGAPLQGGMRIHRYLGNRGLTLLQNLVLGTRLSEFHSGYRAYSTDALRRIPFERLTSDFHFDTEIIILLLEHGGRIAEIPIPTRYGAERSHVNVWRYGADVVVTTLSYYLHKRGIRRSANWSRILAEPSDQ